jgi:uncharacterized membrane protein
MSLELTVLLALHALAAVVWVGGMAFAYCFLRPAATAALAGPDRLRLWRAVFARFFPTVWAAAAILLITGYLMVARHFGGFAGAGMHIHLMHGLALVMVAVFAHVFFAPWRRLQTAVANSDTEQGASQLARIRRWVAVNLALGMVVVMAGASGRYWP